VPFLVEPRIDMDQRCERRNNGLTGFRNVAHWGWVVCIVCSQAVALAALEETWDFDSARQLGRAFVAVSRDLPASDRLPAEVSPAIEELSNLLALAPADASVASGQPPELPTAAMHIALSNYEPSKFQAVFRRLATAMATAIAVATVPRIEP
jgi:hypothetical protein